MRRVVIALTCVLWGCGPLAAAARADFPYGLGGTRERPTHHTAPGQVPNDLDGDDSEFKFAATPEDGNLPVNSQRSELCGVRGGHVGIRAVDEQGNVGRFLEVTRPR